MHWPGWAGACRETLKVRTRFHEKVQAIVIAASQLPREEQAAYIARAAGADEKIPTTPRRSCRISRRVKTMIRSRPAAVRSTAGRRPFATSSAAR
ncbi:MAG: hypothetical protein B6D36_11770 [Planctomycetes bacterium UTPLA1]|nr:MAG: hypothetical protein B6D36_11770 [Planctomycetes bacterium UTPLA1]